MTFGTSRSGVQIPPPRLAAHHRPGSPAGTVPPLRGCSSMARAPAFQAGDAGSIPVTRSANRDLRAERHDDRPVAGVFSHPRSPATGSPTRQIVCVRFDSSRARNPRIFLLAISRVSIWVLPNLDKCRRATSPPGISAARWQAWAGCAMHPRYRDRVLQLSVTCGDQQRDDRCAARGASPSRASTSAFC